MKNIYKDDFNTAMCDLDTTLVAEALNYEEKLSAKKSRRSVFVRIAAAAAVFALVFTGAVTVFKNYNLGRGNGEDTVVTKDSEVDVNIQPGELIVDNVSESFAEMSFEEMLEESHLVVMGEITGISEAFAVKPINGGDASNFYEYELTIEEKYVGYKNVGEKISIRVRGGTVGNVRTVCSVTPELSVGQKVVVILKKAYKGSNMYVTDEDYYLISGACQGLYLLDSVGGFVTSYCGDIELSKRELGEMRSEIMEFAKGYEVDFESGYKKHMNFLDERLNEGSITKEEYELYRELYSSYAERVG